MAMGCYANVELQGQARESALRRIQEQLRLWGLTMPEVTPLPLHFGLARFEEIGETEFWIANEVRHGYCGKFLFLFGGQTCPEHHHRMKHETFFVVRGAVWLSVDGERRKMEAGDVLAVEPGRLHSITGVGNSLLLEVSQPSVLNDNFFADQRIGTGGVI